MKNKQSEKLWAVIPSAGSGKRFSSTELKQYQMIAGQTVLEHSLNALASLNIEGYVLAIAQNDSIIHQLKLPKQTYFCQGGAERVNSVLNGLYHLKQHCQASDDDWVLVHDAARPCVYYDDLCRLYEYCRTTQQSAILAMPVRDTLKKANHHQVITNTVQREQLWQAQTPQMAKLGRLIHAIEYALNQGLIITDEASALEYIGEPVHLVQGRLDNLKITYADDLKLAELILFARQ